MCTVFVGVNIWLNKLRGIDRNGLKCENYTPWFGVFSARSMRTFPPAETNTVTMRNNAYEPQRYYASDMISLIMNIGNHTISSKI